MHSIMKGLHRYGEKLLKRTGFRLSTALIVFAVTTGTTFGLYNTSVVNNLMPVIVDHSATDNNTNQSLSHGMHNGPSGTLWSWVVASFSLGCIPGIFLAAPVAENLGRRPGLLISGVVEALGGFLCLLYREWFLLVLFGRLLMGVSFGIGITLAYLMVTEVAPTRIRGACTSILQAGSATGDILGMILSLPQLLGSLRLSSLALGLNTLTACIMLAIMLFAHESPRYLILKRKRFDGGKKALHFYLTPDEASKMFDSLTLEQGRIEQRQGTAKAPPCPPQIVSTLWRMPRKALLVTCSSLSLPLLTGISAIMGYSTDVFVRHGFTFTVASYATVALGCCNFISSFISIRLIERLGRRLLLIVGLGGVVIGLFAYTICSAILTSNSSSNEYLTNGSKSALSYAVVISLLIYAFFYSFLTASASTLAAEACHDQRYRSYALSWGNFCGYVFSTISVLIYEPILSRCGVSWVFLLFPLICLPVGFFLYACVPETTGIDLENVRV